MQKTAILELLDAPKMISRFEWQKNPEISILYVIHSVKIVNKPTQVCTFLHPVDNGFLWATTFSFLTAHFSILFYWETSALEKGRLLVHSKGSKYVSIPLQIIVWQLEIVHFQKLELGKWY